MAQGSICGLWCPQHGSCHTLTQSPAVQAPLASVELIYHGQVLSGLFCKRWSVAPTGPRELGGWGGVGIPATQTHSLMVV